jgi:hypothetical protein
MARHDARSATLCKPFPKRDLLFHYQPLAEPAVEGTMGIRVTAHDLRRGSFSAQQAIRIRPRACVRSTGVALRRIGREEAGPKTGGEDCSSALSGPQRPSASPVSLSTAMADLSTRIGLVEDEGKPSRPKQA